jgi:glutathione S-transferase
MQDEYCVLHEEASMLQYLEEYYPDPPMMPSKDDRKRRSEVLVLFHESIGVFASSCRAVLSHFLNEDNPSSSTQNAMKEKVKEAKIIVTNELTRWEKLLQSHNEPFLVGKDITIVDVAFFPYFAHLLRYGFNVKKMPRLESYYDVMCKRTSVKRVSTKLCNCFFNCLIDVAWWMVSNYTSPMAQVRINHA